MDLYLHLSIPYYYRVYSVTLERILIQNSIVLKITLFSHRSVPASVKKNLWSLNIFSFCSLLFIFHCRCSLRKLIIDKTEIVEFEKRYWLSTFISNALRQCCLNFFVPRYLWRISHDQNRTRYVVHDIF